MVIDEPIGYQEVDPKRGCLISCLLYLPHKYLYERVPYNRSTWFQFRRIWFWFFLVFEIFPFYGVQSFFYFFVFLMIDKKDEWQLFTFSGIGGGFIGYIQYFMCQSFGQKEYLSEFKKCTEEGPGVNVNLYADIIAIILQICLTWFAYFLIPMSKSKGKNIEFRYNKEKLYDESKKEEDEKECCCFTFDVSKGGRLSKFMVYDLIVFILLVGAFFGFIYGLEKKSLWQIRQILFMTKTLYCLLNFPFIIFTLPIIPQIITEARKTGYDPYGVCVPRIIKYTDKEWDEIEKKYDKRESKINAENQQKYNDDEKELLQSIDIADIYK